MTGIRVYQVIYRLPERHSAWSLQGGGEPVELPT
jgi:hypothetical protein